MEKVDTTARLAKLRALMKERQVQVYSELLALSLHLNCGYRIDS